MRNKSVSFGIGIKFTNAHGFTKSINGWSQTYKSRAPWTLNQIVKGEVGYATGIKNCTGGGIITKSKDVITFHLDPVNEYNKDFSAIKEMLLRKIDEDEPCSQFLLGLKVLDEETKNSQFFKLMYPEATEIIKKSQEMFAKIEEFMGQFKIPLSKFKGIPILDEIGASFACNPAKDRLTIFLSDIGDVKSDADIHKILKSFHGVVIADTDKIIFK